MNIPPHIIHSIPNYGTSANLAIKRQTNKLFELLKLPINNLISAATANTPFPKLLSDKIDLLRQNYIRNNRENAYLDSSLNKYDRALRLRLFTLYSLFTLEDSSRCLLFFQEKQAIFNIVNAVLCNEKSRLIHYISSLTSIAHLNKSFPESKEVSDFKKVLAKIIETTLYSCEDIAISELIMTFSLFSILWVGETTAGDSLLQLEDRRIELKFNDNYHAVLEKSASLLLDKNLSIESQSLLLESIGHIHSTHIDKLVNTNRLLQKLLHMNETNLIESNDKFPLIPTGGIQNTEIVSKISYGIFKTGHANSPFYNQLIESLTEDVTSKMKFKDPNELFRTSFALIVGNQLFKTHISKWILKETVRLSQDALKYPSQFLFLLTGLSLCPDLKVTNSDKSLGSSISFDKSIYEKAEAELKQIETGELEFSSDVLSIRHLFSLAESLVTSLNNEEFVQILHTFCSTKLRHSRLVKIKLYSESIKRLPNLPLQALPQLLRAFSWLLGIRSEESRRLGSAVTDRLIGELIKEPIPSSILIQSLVQLDRYTIFSNELGSLSCVSFAKNNYAELSDLPFSVSVHILHYISNSTIIPSVTVETPKESDVDIVRDILFSKCLYRIRGLLEDSAQPTDDLAIDDITNLLHSAHIRGEITRLDEMVQACITLVNMGIIGGMTGDSLSSLTKLLTVMLGKEYKFNLKNAPYITLTE